MFRWHYKPLSYYVHTLIEHTVTYRHIRLASIVYTAAIIYTSSRFNWPIDTFTWITTDMYMAIEFVYLLISGTNAEVYSYTN